MQVNLWVWICESQIVSHNRENLTIWESNLRLNRTDSDNQATNADIRLEQWDVVPTQKYTWKFQVETWMCLQFEESSKWLLLEATDY